MKFLFLLSLFFVPSCCQLFTDKMKGNKTILDPVVSNIKLYAHSVVALPIVSIGLVGNLLSLLVLTRPALKGVMYVYLRWLAVSNLCVLLAAVPALLDISHGLRGGFYAVAFYQAYLKIPLINIFMASSVYIIIFMTFNRFCSIWKPVFFKRFHTVKNAVVSITLCFLFGFVIHIPLCFQNTIVPQETWLETNHSVGSRVIFYESVENDLVADSPVFKAYLIISEIFLRIGPILVLAVLNPLIIFKYREIVQKKGRLQGKPQLMSPNVQVAVTVNVTFPFGSGPVRKIPLRAKEDRMMALLLVSLVLLFLVCTTPAAILSVSYSDKLTHDFGFQLFRAVANNLELLNFTLNFYIYCLCSSEIRTAFVDMFSSMFAFLRRTEPQSTVTVEVKS